MLNLGVPWALHERGEHQELVLGPARGRDPPRSTMDSSSHPESLSRPVAVPLAAAPSPETKTPLGGKITARE